jgi:methyl-accepting chemotaxis protein
VQISEEAGKALTDVVERAKKVSQLLSGISVSSMEQSRGIEEITMAVGQMDKVTQQNTSNAEELSAASQEMSGQAQVMQTIVKDLVRVLEGAGSKGELDLKDKKTETAGISRQPSSQGKPQAGVTKTDRRWEGKKTGAGLAPEKVIPLDAEDLKNF